MNPILKRVALPWVLAGLVAAAAAEPLTFGRALDLAEQQSPSLQAGDESIRAAQSEAQASGRLPDPRLTIGVDNYPVSGPMRGSLERDFMTMQKLELMQEVPNAAKRAAQLQAAAATVATSEAAQRVGRWKVRVAAAQAWLARSYLERKVDVLDAVARENAARADALLAQLAAGRSGAVESIEQQQEQARLEDRRDELRRDIAKAVANLRQLIGDGADAPITGAAPDMDIDPQRLRARLSAHPQLQAFVAAQAVADADINAAKAQKRPDWGVELAYARRGPQFGNMVSVQFTIGLPWFGAARQDLTITSKAMQRSRVAAEREQSLREQSGALESALAERDALLARSLRAQQQSVPLAQRRLAVVTAAYGGAKASLSTVLAARRELLDEQLRAIDLQSQLDAVTASLYFTYESSEQ